MFHSSVSLDKKLSAQEKDQVANLLKLSPNAFECFEKSYQNYVLDKPESSTNLFKVNKSMIAKVQEGKFGGNDTHLEALEEQITKELLDQSKVYYFDGKKGTYLNFKQSDEIILNPITQGEIATLPKELRPDLTGQLMKVDLQGPAFPLLFKCLYDYLDTNEMTYYHQFRRGLDLLDLDPVIYEALGLNPASMGNWLPQLVKANQGKTFFKIPKTKVLKVPMTLLQLTRLPYENLQPITLRIVNAYIMSVFDLDSKKSYFNKTGTNASKFDFRNAKIPWGKKVTEMGEHLLYNHYISLLHASPLSSHPIYGIATTNEWVVREFIEDKENNPSIHMGLPLHTEYRVFVDCDTKEVLSVCNYWDEDALLKRFGFENDYQDPNKVHDYIAYQAHKETIYERFEKNKDPITQKVHELIQDLELKGQWSLDIMQNAEDFWLIDMAPAPNSTLKESIPKDKQKPFEENWIPDLRKLLEP